MDAEVRLHVQAYAPVEVFQKNLGPPLLITTL